MAEYPAIRRIHEEVVQGVPNTEVSISVQRVDHSLMYWEPQGVDGHNHFVVSQEGKSGTYTQFAFILNTHGDIVRRIDRIRGEYHPFRENFVTPPAIYPGHVGYVLVVTRYDWFHSATKDEEKAGLAHGAHCARQVQYTVYLPPREGMQHVVETADICKNVELSENLLIRGFIAEDEQFKQVMNTLNRLATEFEEQVHEKGLSILIDKSKMRGMSGQFGQVSLMSWTMCGRLMVTFEAPDSKNPELRDTFTIIGNEPPGKANFRFRSMYTTADRAVELVQTVINIWSVTPEKKRKSLFGNNKDVKLDVLHAMGK